MSLSVKTHVITGWIGDSQHGFEMILNPEFVTRILVCNSEVVLPPIDPPTPVRPGTLVPPEMGRVAKRRFPPGNTVCEDLQCAIGIDLFLYFFGDLSLMLDDRCVSHGYVPLPVVCTQAIQEVKTQVAMLREEGAIRSLRLRYDLGDYCETGTVCWEHPARGWICLE